MGHKLNVNYKIAFAAFALIAGGSLARVETARADSPLQQNSAQNNAAPAATLQVTGTATRFSVAANHADVQDALKTVFDQAGKQFLLDSNVAGQITLRLADQPLNVTLDAICHQAFLRYRTSAVSGITTIERDDDALRAAFTRLRSLDASLREQMRLLGLSLPSDNSFGNQQGYRGGGLGDANSVSSENGNNLREGLDNAIRASRRVLPAPAPGTPAAKNGQALGAERTMQILPQGPAAGRSAEADSGAALPVPTDPAELQQFLQTNNFVSFHIPADKPEPVYSVLQSLGQQAKVNLLIDPNVPSGPKFTLRGSLPPRPLPEALNLLTRYARLEWRWVGSAIFVQAAPDFAIFYGDEKEPRARYAPQRKTDTPASASKTSEPKDPPKTKP